MPLKVHLDIVANLGVWFIDKEEFQEAEEYRKANGLWPDWLIEAFDECWDEMIPQPISEAIVDIQWIEDET